MEKSAIHFFKYKSGFLFFSALLIVSFIIGYFVQQFSQHTDAIYFWGFALSVPILLTVIIVKIEKRCVNKVWQLLGLLLGASLLLSYLIIYW
ncbi:hypothetical protein [Kurthia senegalensis]|uniref:hypothetical protein n=1 Tax=Kurthia senegalensis TaxID=1033740 RepID=UPI0002897CFA|nr:hypothetical protein [Kurthia senegalensis]